MAGFKEETLKELLKGYEKPEDLLGERGILKELKKALIERALGAELTEHLGYEKGERPGVESGNSRKGTARKRSTTKTGQSSLRFLEIETGASSRS